MSQYPSYGFQYAEGNECLLCSWILMGRVYPVTESYRSKKTLRGEKMKENFDSHYVLVNRAGISLSQPVLTWMFQECLRMCLHLLMEVYFQMVMN